LSLPCAKTRRTAKTFPLSCAIGKHTTNIYVCRVFPSGARQTYTFLVCFPTVHGKQFLKFLNFVLLLISPLKHYFVLDISKLYMSPLIYYF
jgi:hypothetical protein